MDEYTDKELDILRRMKKLPAEICEHIVSFIPPKPKPKQVSGLQKQVDKLQKSPKQSAMYLKGLDDFVIQ